MMLPGYNTNGFAHHTLRDTLAILSELGYSSVALTLEHDHLDPPDISGVAACVQRLQPLVEAAGMRVTIETGSRFILDPRHKHQPTLLSGSPEGRRKRLEFLKAAIDVASAISADSVSLWSGAPEGSSAARDGCDHKAVEAELFDRLQLGLGELLEHAEAGQVRLSFEPEPGMFIDTMAKYAKLHAALDHALFGLTLDIGHIHCLDDGGLRDHLRRWRSVLWNVHIEDMRRGVHEHLMFGEGEMDFALVFDALREVDYLGPLHVELPRHSHNAVEIARRSYEFLKSNIGQER